MNWTWIDWIVVITLGIFLATHFVTATAVEYYRDVSGLKNIVKAIEGDPVAEIVLSLGKLGHIIKIIMVASLFGLWFGVLRKYQFYPEHWEGIKYSLCTIFFAALYIIVNDLAHLLGLLL